MCIRDRLCSWQSQLKVTNIVSLDEVQEAGPEPVMDATHNSHFAQPEDVISKDELKQMLLKSLDSLTEKERRVIAVSYTHLDVYKRQGLDNGKESRYWSRFIFTLCSNIFYHSYSLDVYKRQSLVKLNL